MSHRPACGPAKRRDARERDTGSTDFSTNCCTSSYKQRVIHFSSTETSIGYANRVGQVYGDVQRLYLDQILLAESRRRTSPSLWLQAESTPEALARTGDTGRQGVSHPAGPGGRSGGNASQRICLKVRETIDRPRFTSNNRGRAVTKDTSVNPRLAGAACKPGVDQGKR